MGWGYDWKPYVSVGQRKSDALAHAEKRAKKAGRKRSPVVIEKRKITTTFWGNAWCQNLERYSDFSNRLPRGRTYVCNGSVVDLDISSGKITAVVAGSMPYDIKINIDKLSAAHWKRIRSDCSSSIDSLMDLLSGKFSDGVMARLTDAKQGLFPNPGEIKMSCSCPDWAGLCKHLAAVMYGIGSHLDHRPELLFLLRGVDHHELVSAAVASNNLDAALSGADGGLDNADLGALFGIELDNAGAAVATASKTQAKGKKRRAASSAKIDSTVKPAAKKKAVRKTAKKKSPNANVEAPSKPAKRVATTRAAKKQSAKPRSKTPVKKK